MDYNRIARQLPQDEAGVLFDVNSLYARCLALVDTRKARGQVFALALVLVATVLAKLAGEDTPTGIAAWNQLRCDFFVEAFQLKHRRMPHADTYRRLLGRVVDVAAFERLISDFLHELLQAQAPAGRYLLVALDGKSLRGTIPLGSSRGLHLLAAYVPAHGLVLFQVAVDQKTNEIKAAPEVLKMVDLRGKIVTGDALLAQRELSQLIVDGGGHFLWTVKDNQPTTVQAIAQLFAPQTVWPGHGPVPTDFQTAAQPAAKDHGRLETRTLTSSAMLADYLDWPGLQQVFRVEVERTTVIVATGERRHEVVYGLTSLSRTEANARQLLEYNRGHWGIENGLHHRRDATLHEDALRAKSTRFAQVIAAINNLVIGLALHYGIQNLAQARRQWAAHPDEALALLLGGTA